jgi:hypothetical protein
MWIIRQAEYEIERGMRQLSSRQAERRRQETNRVIFVDGIFSTLSDKQIIREAFNGLGSLGGNFQIIGFLHSPTWTNDSSFFSGLPRWEKTHQQHWVEPGRLL